MSEVSDEERTPTPIEVAEQFSRDIDSARTPEERVAEATGAAWDADDAPLADFLAGDQVAAEPDAERQREADEIRARLDETTAAAEEFLADQEQRTTAAAAEQIDRAHLEHALQRYEAGEEPASIADYLAEHAPTQLQPLLDAWQAETLGVGLDEFRELQAADQTPDTPEDWLEQAAERAAGRQRVAELEAQNEARRAEQQRLTDHLEAMGEAVKHAIETKPRFREVAGDVEQIIGGMTIPVRSREDADLVLDLAYKGALDQRQARAAAQIRTDMDEQQHLYDSGGLQHGEPPAFDRQAAFERNLAAETINVDRLRPPTPPDQVAGRIAQEWDKLDEPWAAGPGGWNV